MYTIFLVTIFDYDKFNFLCIETHIFCMALQMALTWHYWHLTINTNSLLVLLLISCKING